MSISPVCSRYETMFAKVVGTLQCSIRLAQARVDTAGSLSISPALGARMTILSISEKVNCEAVSLRISMNSDGSPIVSVRPAVAMTASRYSPTLRLAKVALFSVGVTSCSKRGNG